MPISGEIRVRESHRCSPRAAVVNLHQQTPEKIGNADYKLSISLKRLISCSLFLQKCLPFPNEFSFSVLEEMLVSPQALAGACSRTKLGFFSQAIKERARAKGLTLCQGRFRDNLLPAGLAGAGAAWDGSGRRGRLNPGADLAAIRSAVSSAALQSFKGCLPPQPGFRGRLSVPKLDLHFKTRPRLGARSK